MTRALRSQAVPIQTANLIADLTVQARDAILSERDSKAKAKKNKKAAGEARLESGRYLFDLKTMIDADRSLSDGETFWQWFDRFFVKEKICSRKDAEKRIGLARSADPDGAAAEERRKARERMQTNRAAPANTAVRGNQPQQNQQDKEGEGADDTATQPTANHKAQSSDNVVSLRVENALKLVRAMTEPEREQLYAQLRKEDLL